MMVSDVHRLGLFTFSGGVAVSPPLSPLSCSSHTPALFSAVPTHLAAANRICALDKDRTLRGLILPHLLTLEKFAAPFLGDLPLTGHLALLYLFATYGRELPPKLHKQIATQLARHRATAGSEVSAFLAWCEAGCPRSVVGGGGGAGTGAASPAALVAAAHFDCLAGPTSVVNEAPRSTYVPPEAPQPVVNALWALARHGLGGEAFQAPLRSTAAAAGEGDAAPQVAALGTALLEAFVTQLASGTVTNEALLRGAWAVARCGGRQGAESEGSDDGGLWSRFSDALAAAIVARDPGLLAPLTPVKASDASSASSSAAGTQPRVLRARGRAAAGTGTATLTAGGVGVAVPAPPLPPPPSSPAVFTYPQRVLLLWCFACVGSHGSSSAPAVRALAAHVFGVPGHHTQADTAGGLQTASPATLQLLKQTATLLTARDGGAALAATKPLPDWVLTSSSSSSPAKAATATQGAQQQPVSLTEAYEPPSPRDAAGLRSVAAALAPRAGTSPQEYALQSVATGLKQAGTRARRGYVIDGYQVDFAVPEARVALDVLGGSDTSPAAVDAAKASYLTTAGWRYVTLDYPRWRGMGRADKLATLIHLVAAREGL